MQKESKYEYTYYQNTQEITLSSISVHDVIF